MSVFIKIDGWLGSGQDDVTRRFTKVFRMTQEEGDSAMDQICQNPPWQFDRRTSDSQSGEAETYLTRLGFDVELIPVSGIDWEAPADAAQEFEEAEEIPGKPKRKSKFTLSKVAMLAIPLIIILGAGGLSQTQFGKDLINNIGSQAKGLIGSSGTPSDVSKDSPSSVPDQPAGTETPKTPSNVKAIKSIAVEGGASKKYPMTLSGCLENRDQLNAIFRKADLQQTQSDLICTGKFIPNPAAEWKCEFLTFSKICEPNEAYSCAMQYQCVPETADYNREKFKKELAALS